MPDLPPGGEAAFRRLVEAAPFGVHSYRLDDRGRLIFVEGNPAADQILGIDHRRLVGLVIEDAFPGLSGTEVPTRYHAIARDGGVWRSEQITYRDEHITGAFEVVAFQIEPGAMAAMFQDIATRKRAEIEVQRTRDEWVRTFDLVPDLIAIVDVHRRLRRCNRALCERLGQPADELIGRPCHEAIHGTTSPPSDCPLPAVYDQGQPVDCDRFEPRLGGWVHLTATPVRDDAGRITGVIHIARDINERRRTEERNRRHQERLQALHELVLHATEPLPILLDLALRHATALTGSGRGCVHLATEFDDVGGTWCWRQQLTPLGPPPKTCPIWDPAAPPWLPAVEARRPLIIDAAVIPNPDLAGSAVTRGAGFDRPHPATDLQKPGSTPTATGSAPDTKPATPSPAPTGSDPLPVGSESRAAPDDPESQDAAARVAGTGLAADETISSNSYQHEITAPLKHRIAVPFHDDQGELLLAVVVAERRDGRYSDDDLQQLTLLVEELGRILQRRRFLQALRASEKRLRRMVDSSPVATLIVRKDRSIEAFNQKWRLLFGFRPNELISVDAWIERAAPDPTARTELAAAIDRMFAAARNGNGTAGPETLQLGSAEGAIKTCECHYMDFTDWGIWTAHDLTPVLEAEAEKARIQRQMLQAQKLESLGVLAGGLAHDFNNILTAILGNADLALLQTPADTPARHALEEVVNASRRAAGLCQQLLAYSGKGRFVIRRIDLSELVRSMMGMLEMSVSKRFAVRCHLPCGLPPVEVDVTQIQQVIMNLVINAAEAIGDRTGSIAITTGTQTCDAAYLASAPVRSDAAPGRFVYCEIADQGHGMDAETLRRIFDPFFSTKFMGRGLGLAAVLGIIRGHHGAIRVYSEPGQGTSFKILLPAKCGVAERLESPAAETPTWRGRGTILMVDDEPAIRELGRLMLAEAGFTVLTATDGRAALEIIDQRGADLACVILDLTMPTMDGEETFRELRQRHPGLKVILSSGFNHQDVSQRFVGRGLAGFIQKPYQMATLLTVLRQVLGDPPESGSG